jgi:hypothetical protein
MGSDTGNFMKVAKARILLSPYHPSLLLDLPREANVPIAPLIIDESLNLIDGYRRYQIHPHDEVEVVQVPATNIFQAALDCNRNTRPWDETDCFLWCRWANKLEAPAPHLPFTKFPDTLWQADEQLLRLLARRRLLFKQVVGILQAPLTYQPFFSHFLSTSIDLNANETFKFIEMAMDLRKICEKPLEQFFEQAEFSTIIGNSGLNRKQKGEALLKALRTLRYPTYHKKAEQFSSYWRQLDFGSNIQVNTPLFLERGIMELRLTASSTDEMQETLVKLCGNLESILWKKIWEE